MTESIQHRIVLPHSIDAVHKAMTSEDVITRVINAYGPDGSELLEYENDGTKTRYRARVVVPSASLGFLVRMAASGDVVVILEQTWTRDGDKATGTANLSMEGKPEQEVTLSTGLAASNEGTAWTVEGVIDVGGLLGSKIESTIVEQVDKLVKAEAAYIDKLLAS